MALVRFTAEFDNGDAFDVEVRSRDYVKLEEADVDLETVKPMHGSYLLAHTALLRLERSKAITPSDPIPSTVDELKDVCDITPIEDDEGKAEGQEASTG